MGELASPLHGAPQVFATGRSPPGLGAATVQAIGYNDLPMIQGVVLFAAFVVIIANLLIGSGALCMVADADSPALKRLAGDRGQGLPALAPGDREQALLLIAPSTSKGSNRSIVAMTCRDRAAPPLCN